MALMAQPLEPLSLVVCFGRCLANYKKSLSNFQRGGCRYKRIGAIKNFDSCTFLVAKLAYKILAYTFEFKK